MELMRSYGRTPYAYDEMEFTSVNVTEADPLFVAFQLNDDPRRRLFDSASIEPSVYWQLLISAKNLYV